MSFLFAFLSWESEKTSIIVCWWINPKGQFCIGAFQPYWQRLMACINTMQSEFDIGWFIALAMFAWWTENNTNLVDLVDDHRTICEFMMMMMMMLLSSLPNDSLWLVYIYVYDVHTYDVVLILFCMFDNISYIKSRLANAQEDWLPNTMAVKPQQAPYREAAFTRRSSRKHFKSDTTWKLSCASRRASFSLLIYSFVYYGHTFARCNICIRMIICTRNVCVGIHKFNQSHKCHIYKKKAAIYCFDNIVTRLPTVILSEFFISNIHLFN